MSNSSNFGHVTSQLTRDILKGDALLDFNAANREIDYATGCLFADIDNSDVSFDVFGRRLTFLSEMQSSFADRDLEDFRANLIGFWGGE